MGIHKVSRLPPAGKIREALLKKMPLGFESGKVNGMLICRKFHMQRNKDTEARI